MSIVSGVYVRYGKVYNIMCTCAVIPSANVASTLRLLLLTTILHFEGHPYIYPMYARHTH